MSAVFLKVLNMSITAGWLIGAVFFARLILRRAPKWIFCLLWGMVALRLVIPFSLESVLSLIPSAGTVPADIAVSPRPALDSGINFVDQAVNPVIIDSFAPAPANSVNPLQVVVEAASAVWIAGIAVMLLWALVSYLRLSRKVAASVENGEGTLICDEIDSPFILGIVRPKIYVPSGLAGSSLDCVVRHERAHIARRDHWWKPLGFLILSVYWFNPLCWIAYALLCRDIEGACDEKVIRDLDKAEVSAYSEALLECGVKRRFVSVCPLAFGEVGVKERIKSVLSYKKPAFWIILIALVLCVVLAVCLMTDPKNQTFSIKYDLGNTESHFTFTPEKAKAGEEVELKTDILIDADIHVYVDGREIDKSHYDSDYWGYSFVMPDKDVSVTASFYTKDEIWGSGDLELNALKEKYPEYFGLDTSKGLEVYVWQMAPSAYWFGLAPRTDGEKTLEELMKLKGASAEEMRAILSTYGLDEDMISVIPWENPVSSYLPEYWIRIQGEDPASVKKRRQEYVDNIRRFLFDGVAIPQDPAATVPASSIGEQYDMLPAPSYEQIRKNMQIVQQFSQNKTGLDIPDKVEVTVEVKSFERLSSQCERIAGLIERERWCEAISRDYATEKAYNETAALRYYDKGAMDKHLQAGEVISRFLPLIEADSDFISVGWQFVEYSPRLSQFCDKTDFDPGTAADEDFAYAARCFLKKYLPEYLPEADAETTVGMVDEQCARVQIGGVSFSFSWRENDLQKLSGEKAALIKFEIYDRDRRTAECEVLKIETAFENACAKYGYDAKNTVVYDVCFRAENGVPYYEFLCSRKNWLSTFIITTRAVSVT